MILRILSAPLRLALGLPALYGMSVKNRIQQISRWLGIYKGPIHYAIKARRIHVGTEASTWQRFKDEWTKAQAEAAKAA